MTTKICPLIKEECRGKTCVSYCSILRMKLYKSLPPLKKCPLCNEYLMPFGEVFLHSPKSKCKYAEMIGVTIEVTRDDYEKAIGKPTTTYNEQITYLTTEPISLFRRSYIKVKQTIDKIKQQKQPQKQG